MWMLSPAVVAAFSLITISALPWELSSNKFNLVRDGMDIQRCHKLVYQLKTCSRHFLMLRAKDNHILVSFHIGYERESKMYVLMIGGYREIASAPNITVCNEYRWLWVSWGDGNFSYGTGKTIGKDAIFDEAGPTGKEVQKLSIHGTGFVKFGETGRDRFERMITRGIFVAPPIEEVNSGLTQCASRCSNHKKCGMFNHNAGRGTCVIFDISTPYYIDLTPQNDWTSWKMLYCFS